jgi:RNA polymerase sigma-70 factor (ECF subfamily)
LIDKSEAMLVRQVANENHLAFQQLLDTHLPSINRYVVRMMGNAANAEDITQEVFFRLWSRADSFNPEASKLSTWLHNIAHNLCIDYFRKNSRFTHDSIEETVGGEEPDLELTSETQQQDVKTALMALPERQRSAIIMCHYQGVANKDAANIMDTTVDALESLLSRGRLKLRRILTENGES